MTDMTPEELAEARELARDYVIACDDEGLTRHSEYKVARALLYYTTARPIAEAPKDGTRVLAVTPSGYILILSWCADEYWRARIDDKPGIWNPTHFYPLPPEE